MVTEPEEWANLWWDARDRIADGVTTMHLNARWKANAVLGMQQSGCGAHRLGAEQRRRLGRGEFLGGVDHVGDARLDRADIIDRVVRAIHHHGSHRRSP